MIPPEKDKLKIIYLKNLLCFLLSVTSTLAKYFQARLGPLRAVHSKGRLLALATNIRLGPKSETVANAQAFYAEVFIVQAPGFVNWFDLRVKQ